MTRTSDPSGQRCHNSNDQDDGGGRRANPTDRQLDPVGPALTQGDGSVGSIDVSDHIRHRRLLNETQGVYGPGRALQLQGRVVTPHYVI
jgi:hypothetical protein